MSMAERTRILILALFATVPLYRQSLGYLGANVVLYGIYFLGCMASLASFKTVFGESGILKRMAIPVFLFSVWYAFTANYSISEKLSVKLMLILMLPFYFLGGVYLQQRKERYHLFFRLFVGIVLAVAVYTFFKLKDSNFIYSYFLSSSDAANAVDYLTFSVYCVVALTYLMRVRRYRFYAYSAAAFLGVMILISGGRGPLIFFVVLLVLRSLLMAKGWKNLLVYGGLAVLVGYVALANADSQYFEYTLNRFNSIGSDDQSLAARYDMWDKSWESIAGNPLWGKGINASGMILFGEDSELEYPHNYLIESWLEAGLLCTLLIVWISLKGSREALRQMKAGSMLSGIMFLFIMLNLLKSQSIVDARLLFLFLGMLFTEIRYEENKSADPYAGLQAG